jgi:hypothetical protein
MYSAGSVEYDLASLDSDAMVFAVGVASSAFFVNRVQVAMLGSGTVEVQEERHCDWHDLRGR